MQDIVIIGGGLSGLAAAHELERLKLPYTLIEVKDRLGGSIVSERRNGFVLDGGASLFSAGDDWSFLPELGLDDALCPVSSGHYRDKVVFKEGTQAVIDALARPLRGEILHRMAVSSLGRVGQRFAICLENGLMFDARALIVAAPARYVERMFRTLQPAISQRLFEYPYDRIYRVSLGYPVEAVTLPLFLPWDMGIAFYYGTDAPCRAPAGYALVHVGVRYPLPDATPEKMAGVLQAQFGWPENSVVMRVDAWPEADPIPPHTPDFRTKMAELMGLLPEGVALIGSDYSGVELGKRIAEGRTAARTIAAWLENHA